MPIAIDCDIYPDRVEIKMLGQKPITIAKPVTVPWGEWNSFWHEKRSRGSGNYGPAFTQADADANSRRRLANLPAVQ